MRVALCQQWPDASVVSLVLDAGLAIDPPHLVASLAESLLSPLPGPDQRALARTLYSLSVASEPAAQGRTILRPDQPTLPQTGPPSPGWLPRSQPPGESSHTTIGCPRPHPRAGPRRIAHPGIGAVRLTAELFAIDDLESDREWTTRRGDGIPRDDHSFENTDAVRRGLGLARRSSTGRQGDAARDDQKSGGAHA